MSLRLHVRIVLLSVPCLITLPIQATRGLALDSLIKHKLVSMEVHGLKGLGEEGLRADLRNRTDRSMKLVIPAGWVFHSVDEQVQDLLLAKDVPVELPPRGTRSVLLDTYCTQGPLRAPEWGERYRIGGPGDPALVSLAQAVAAGDYARSLVQAAVWTVANGYRVAGMGALDDSPADTLRLLASRLSGQPPPRYTIRFAEDGAAVCSGRPEAVSRNVRIDAPCGALVSAAVYGPSGSVVQVLDRDLRFSAGTHLRTYEVDVTGWPPGRYALRVWTTTGAWVQQLPFHL